MRIAKIEIFYTSTNLYYTILILTAFIAISNSNSIRTNTRRVLNFVKCFTAICRIIISNRLDEIGLIVNITLKLFLILITFCDEFHISLFTTISYLWHTNTKVFISFCLQYKKGLFQSILRDAQFFFDTCTDIEYSFFFKFLFKSFGSSSSSILTSRSAFIEKRTNRRIICIAHLFRYLIKTKPIFSKRSGSISFESPSFVICNSYLHTIISRSHSKSFTNLFLSKPLAFKFIYSA